MAAETPTLTTAHPPRWRVVDFAEIPGISCPCGIARRAFADLPDYPATIHVTDIAEDAQRHYHKSHTETYFILDCAPDAAIQLDEDVVPLRPGMCVLIPPGVRHRALGRMRIVNIVIPKFDPADEYFD
jgi:mannose-6-phosphate isomerase-like protein (cupin superfamily)